jgi:hypothetical protein
MDFKNFDHTVPLGGGTVVAELGRIVSLVLG